MASHRFKVGQAVAFSPGRRSLPAAPSQYRIARLMPSDSGENWYRVKCTAEPFERTARETELSYKLGHDPSSL